MARRPFSFSGWYKDWFFRSFKELSYALDLDTQGLKWESAEKKELSTTYVDRYGHTKGHWADFLVEGKTIVEVKPTKLQKNKIVQLKTEAMRQWCAAHGYEYKIVAPRRINKVLLKYLVDQGVVQLEEHLKTSFDFYIKGKKKRKR